MGSLLPGEYMKISLSKMDSVTRRKITLEPFGRRFEELEEVLRPYEGIGH